MLKFIIIEENSKEVIYEYYPEDGVNSGTISVTKKTGEMRIIKLAINDKHQRYALKLLKKIREFQSNDSYKKEGIVAWS